MLEYPELDSATRGQVAEVAGVLQSFEETVLTKFAFGRFKATRKALGKVGGKSVMGRFGINLAAGTAAEMFEEKVQQATLPAVQSLLTGLDKDAPKVDWEREWKEIAGGNARLFFAVLPLTLIGAGAATHADFKGYRQITENRKLLEAAKLDSDQIDKIVAEESPEKRDKLIQAAFQEREGRLAREAGFTDEFVGRVEVEPDEGKRRSMILEGFAEEEKAQRGMAVSSTAVDVDEEGNAVTTLIADTAPLETAIDMDEEGNAVATPVDDAVFTEADLWEDLERRGAMPSITKEGQWYEVRLPDGEQAERFDSLDAAAEWSRGWLDEQAKDLPGQAAREYAELLSEYHGDASVKFTDKAMSLKEYVDKELITLEQAQLRAKLAGIDDISEAYIFGENRLSGRGQAARMMIEIHREGDAMTVAEEFAEGFLKRHFHEGTQTASEVAGMLFEYEHASGRAYLPGDFDALTEEEQESAVLEGFSDLGMEYLAGNVDSKWLPEKLKRWFELIFDTVMATVMKGARVLRQMQESGQLDARLESLLAEAVGVSEAPLIRQMEAEQQAEVDATSETTSGALKGKLPHPEAMRKKGDPLAGEMEAVYQAMRADQNLGASQSSRTREANSYFLPKEQWEDPDRVMMAINEEGFDFDTPGEMLDALLDEAGHGAETRAVVSGVNFSVKKEDAIRIREAIRKQTSVKVSTEGMPTDLSARQAVAWLVDGGVLGETTHSSIGKIEIRPRGLKNAIGHVLTPRKMAAMLKMKDLIRKSELVHLRKREKAADSYRLVGRVDVDGKAYVARIIVDTDANGNRYFNHELSDLEELEKLSGRKNPQAPIPGVGEDQQIGVEELEDTGKLLKWIFSVKEERNQQVRRRNDQRDSARAFRQLEAKLRAFERTATPGQKAQLRAQASHPKNSKNVLGRPDPQGRQVEGSTGANALGAVPLEVDPAAGFGKPISAPKVIDALTRVLRSINSKVPLRVGRTKKKHLGAYYVRERLIRLRTANDITTAAHEVAHALEDALFSDKHEFGKDKSVPQKAKDELSRIGKALYGGTNPTGGYHSEGFAELLGICFWGKALEGGGGWIGEGEKGG